MEKPSEKTQFLTGFDVLKLSHILPRELKISYDYGSHFEVMGIPAFGGSNEAGWNVGEFFKGSYSYELSSYYLTHSMDFNQTTDTVYNSEQDFLNMRAGAKEGELYTYYPSYDDLYYIISCRTNCFSVPITDNTNRW